MLETARGHELHADANAEEGPAARDHGLVQRGVKAIYRHQAAPAVGEGADARQHHGFGAAHDLGIAGDANVVLSARFARGALEGFQRGVKIARPIVDNGRRQGLGSPTALSLAASCADAGQRWKNAASASSTSSPITRSRST